ncbi:MULTISPECIES: acetyl-CoA carboxylase biotin carboxylase subunit [Leuconostoc]|uniref:biotin carboxylase n=1 Tax=Leuconostoc kimchii (strain IMSNU 11154 / KCTC 2386 / IH25) TaxID=762051 RepID=D5T015_LEUKI|nr:MULTISPECIES: biotin carboxylase N-terminal domain-containing protein [Leuconostoc]ADG39614.1 Acetyl-CoA carboxylase, biotin carboxylase [Leuconostoc kimchii IMSNU 11154]AWV37877.1 acetyl-CoA carboxylase biotin carboxylase subunit [Leuconostoc mesenteroides]KAA8378352.1 acetyl-CoA carboxylase biotin carboxylase subunit [Leuconostoc mesenteroides]MBZ5991335.1 acetyl-CoA carboxylase biotin carboxylase subunit [Leuconostoc gelidum subsp. gelidum]MCT8390197.1 acetyl-CoA carboxylase biotin carbo
MGEKFVDNFKVLIANRGEIAVRIIRAVKMLGFQTVAVYSSADKDSLHVAMADESVQIGPSNVADSYLNQKAILAAAEITHADAIHPGYGFLSENPNFAKQVEEMGIVFIGPTSEVIAQMGDKEKARQFMSEAGVPIVSGSDSFFEDVDIGFKQAKKIGYPVMLKSVAGGGGKGMRLVSNQDSFKSLFEVAQSEIMASVGDPRMYLEKFVSKPRHIEVQILGDGLGNAIVLGERDCTIQSHHQKVIEEAPSHLLDETTRKKMLAVSLNAVKRMAYRSAGTFEFLYQGPGKFYFMEMNTRIQVEHAISEEVSGIDIVSAQIQLASGRTINDISIGSKNNFAIEARVSALSAGTITGLHLPTGLGIRIETAVYQGYKVPPYYDAMIVKIIATGMTRHETLKRLQIAIEETVILGVETNLDLLMRIIIHPDYMSDKNKTDIDWLDFQMKE